MTNNNLENKTLIMGLGNALLCDDGIGIHIVQKLEQKNLPENVVVEEAGTAGIGILDFIVGYKKLIIVDAIEKGENPGTIIEMDGKNLLNYATLHAASIHDADIVTAMELGRKLNLQIPKDVKIYGIQIKDVSTFSMTCTPEVAKTINQVCERIIREIK